MDKNRHRICIPIVEKGKEDIYDYAEKISKTPADMMEWRADYFECVDNVDSVEEVLKELKKYNIPILFTMRSKKEGGRCDIHTLDYINILKNISDKNLVDLVDIELSRVDELPISMIENMQKKGISVILSYHCFDNTASVESLMEIAIRQLKYHPDIIKIATMANTQKDVDNIMTFSEKFKLISDTDLIAIAMGSLGVESRYKSAIVFCALEKSSAPGQVSVYMATSDV